MKKKYGFDFSRRLLSHFKVNSAYASGSRLDSDLTSSSSASLPFSLSLSFYSSLVLIASFLLFSPLAEKIIFTRGLAAAETAAVPEFSMDDEAICGDYIYKITSCSLNKQEAKNDSLSITLSVRNTGPDSGPFPPLSLMDASTKKEIKPAEKLPKLNAGSSLIVNLNFSVAKKASYLLKVSGDAEGYLNAHINLNAEVSDPKNELLQAAADGDAQKIRELIKKGANVNAVNSKKETALMLAAKSGNSAAVKVLLDNKANYKVSNLDDEHALYYAIDSGDYDTVKILLEKGSDTYYTNYRGKTPLIAAKSKGDEKIIELVRLYSSRGY